MEVLSMKPIVIVLIVLWIGLIFITAVNMHNQFLINRQSLRIVKLYQLKAELNPIFRDAQDSLSNEIVKAEQLSKQLVKPFPIKNEKQNWLMLRLTVVFLSVLSGSMLFMHYKKNQ